MDARALAAQIRAIRAQVDALLIAAEGAPAIADVDEELVGCPHCGADEEKIEDTTETVFGGDRRPRSTCLSCGKSWDPTARPAREERNDG